MFRFLRKILVGHERDLARWAEARRWSPSLELLRRFEQDHAIPSGHHGVVFGRLADRRGCRRRIGLSRERLREVHLAFSGATGSGKTTSAVGITVDMLRAGGTNLVNVDPKGDTSAALEGFDAARASGGRGFPGVIKFIRPFDPNVAPQLRLTAREQGVSSEVQALALVSSLEEACGADMGLRMRSIAAPLATLAIELELPLSIVVDWLGSPRAFSDAAVQSSNERIRAYARTQFPKESRESISAIRSRLEAILLLPVVRRALEARTFLPIADWIERHHLNFDWSRPPAGQEAAVRALSGPVMGRLTRALLNRATTEDSPHLWLLCDELPELLGRFETLSLGRLLTLARSRGVSCVFLQQQRSQLPRELQELLRTNAGVEFVFSANHRDATTYSHALPVAEDEPKPAALRARLVRRLARQPRRHFLLIIKDSPLGGQFMVAPTIRIPKAPKANSRVPSCGDPIGAEPVSPRKTDGAAPGRMHPPRAPEPEENSPFPEMG